VELNAGEWSHDLFADQVVVIKVFRSFVADVVGLRPTGRGHPHAIDRRRPSPEH